MIERVIFIGSKDLGLSILEAIYKIAPDKLRCIITIDDSKDTRCSLASFKRFAQKTGKEILVLDKHLQLKSAIDERKPDLCVVSGWYWILKEDLLKKVPAGFVGLHPSMLPKYRGGAPLIWPIINGEKESGISLFYFDKGIDDGDVIAQEKFGIGADETIADLLEKVKFLAVKVFEKNYPLLLDEKAPRTRQNHEEASVYSMRKPEDGRIDWNKPAREIHNAVRAQTHPYPGAFCFTPDGGKMHIWKSRIFDAKIPSLPGKVIEVKDNLLIVGCAGGAVGIEADVRTIRSGMFLK